MIAGTSSRRDFGGLATYLAHGRSGHEHERVDWAIGRNIGTNDPEIAAALMRATAAENVRVRYPAYHLTISFDPRDQVTREQMEQVAVRVLDDLGLSEHQAILVAHNDRAHAHVHIMVNRVHPDTKLAWERWQDRPTIERVLREQERALGLREVAGRLYQLDGQQAPERAFLTNGERRQAARSGEVAFAERVYEHVAEFRSARTWNELEERLQEHGFRLQPKGQGLVITDGERQVKASRIGRDLSLRRLEQRFGVSYEDYREQVGQPLHEQASAHRAGPTSPAVAEVASTVRGYERLTALKQELDATSRETAQARERLYKLENGTRQVAEKAAVLAPHFAKVYRGPDAAYARFVAAVADETRERHARANEAVHALADRPETYGPLLTVERKKALGLFDRHAR